MLMSQGVVPSPHGHAQNRVDQEHQEVDHHGHNAQHQGGGHRNMFGRELLGRGRFRDKGDAGSPKKPESTRVRLQKRQSKLKPIIPAIHPQSRKIALSVFRRLFSILNTRYGSVETKGEIPVLHFVRAMQRFAIVIGQKKRKKDAIEDDDDTAGVPETGEEMREKEKTQKIQADNFASYDVDGSGTVGWWEFVSAWNNNNYEIRHTFLERIFLTIDDQTGSLIGYIISTISLSMIVLSSCCFVIATLPSLTVRTDHCEAVCTPPYSSLPPTTDHYTHNEWCNENCHPDQPDYFYTLEIFCVIVFSLEYFARLFTCHAVRTEFLNDDTMIDMILGDLSLRTKTKRERIIHFVTQPPNIVDLLAIAPFYIEIIAQSDAMKGSVILRVIRLIRLVRLMKTVKYFEQLRIMGRVIKRAMPGLSVLFFYLCLIVVFAGSLMFHAEAGHWNNEKQEFQRWNWQAGEYERSPFRSIPQSFWWTVVTLTTVGYGDMVPMTLLGQALGAATIFLGVLVLAMPISVLSSSFSETWREWHEERRLSAAHEAEEREAIEAALSFRDPILQFHKISIDIYDEDNHGDHDFLGEVELNLDDIGTGPWKQEKHGAASGRYWKSITMDLMPNEYKIVGTKRKVIVGQIDLQISWEPVKPADKLDPELPSEAISTPSKRRAEPWVYNGEKLYPGTLFLKVIRARGVRNADATMFQTLCPGLHSQMSLGGGSDPYARVTYWPFLPSKQGIIEEMTVKTKTIQDTTDPVWDAEFQLQYNWDPELLIEDQEMQEGGSDTGSGPQMASTRVSGQLADPNANPIDRLGSMIAADGMLIGELTKRSMDEIEELFRDVMQDFLHHLGIGTNGGHGPTGGHHHGGAGGGGGVNNAITSSGAAGTATAGTGPGSAAAGAPGTNAAGTSSNGAANTTGSTALAGANAITAANNAPGAAGIMLNNGINNNAMSNESLQSEVHSLRKEVRQYKTDLQKITQSLQDLVDVVRSNNGSTSVTGNINPGSNYPIGMSNGVPGGPGTSTSAGTNFGMGGGPSGLNTSNFNNPTGGNGQNAQQNQPFYAAGMGLG
ncbi:unnamed protein product [Amoebophrya sp. A120]|nr:unnamed protein product [Amoebophrya sp. A120]|eukprot:GSA120T00014319001.1